MIFLMIKPPNLNGAHDQDRTGDLILTKDVLYQLSYVGTIYNENFLQIHKLNN